MYANEFSALLQQTNKKNERADNDRLEIISDLQEIVDSGDENNDSGFEGELSELQEVSTNKKGRT